MLKNIHQQQIYDNYIIYPNGAVFSKYVNRFVKPQDNGNGYLKYCFKDSQGKTHQKYIHREVAMYFVPGYKEGLQVDHIDRNKSNNNAINLRWVSASANQTFTDKRYSKTRICNSYTTLHRQWTAALYKAGYSTVEISRFLGIPRQTLRNWVKDIDQVTDKRFKERFCK